MKPSKLENLPAGVLCHILLHLPTAQSIGRLSLTCKALHEVVETQGWSTFVLNQFSTLTIPIEIENKSSWKALAKRLTWQSRSWERRAFSMASWSLPQNTSRVERNRRGGRGRGSRGRVCARPRQTFPPHVVVDASSTISGDSESELVAWGLGEDVFVRWRETTRSSVKSETWKGIKGAEKGQRSGTDDITAISILPDSTGDPSVLVGRASGTLSLVSAAQNEFGRTIASFRPPLHSNIPQIEIQHFDVSRRTATIATIAKESLLFYKLPNTTSAPEEVGGSELTIKPIESFNIREVPGFDDFRQLRQVKFMDNGVVAFCMIGSNSPVRFMSRTPSGSFFLTASKLVSSNRCPDTLLYGSTNPHNARCLIPVHLGANAGGSGNVVLSSYDDGTIRLQDLRTSSPFDTIFQDHFEVDAPLGPLLSYGSERFLAGSARAPVVKIFDFRWSKPYSYTDALSCSDKQMFPKPKSLTLSQPPNLPNRDLCCYQTGMTCNLHAMARSDFWRPSCNVYLSVPHVHESASPVYSLAKSSDLSTTIYAGLTGELTRLSLRDRETERSERMLMGNMTKDDLCGYSYRESLTSLVETGDGIALTDISKTQRLPVLYKQIPERMGLNARRPLQRLDESLF